MKSIIFFTIFLLQITQAFAESVIDPNIKVHQVINKYRNSPAVKMKLEKTVKMSLLGETKSSKGKIYISSNRMRYEITSPENHLVVMGKNSIWIENRLPIDLGGRVQVTHLKSKSGQQQAKGFLAAFFGNSNIKNDLSFKKINDEQYKVIFKKKSKMADIKSAVIGINRGKEEIKYIEFTDSIENVTRHNFTQVEFKKSADSSKFKYKAPKGADVTVM